MSMSLYRRLARRYRPERFEVSRRDLLKATLAASTGLLLSNCNAAGDRYGAATPRLKRKILVIGAGFSGLACAYELLSVGYNVVVLEARNRVGGRVLSFHDMVRGKVVEGGGELIGTNHPTWVNYKEKFGLGFTEIPDYPDLNEPLILEGRTIGKEEAEKIHDEMEKALATLNDAARGINEDEPWKSPNADSLDSSTMSDWLNLITASPITKRAIRAELEANEAVPLERQSYLAFLTMVKGGGLEKYWTDSETCRCTQGNQALAAKLADKLTGFRLHLGKPVKSITHGWSGITVTTPGNETFHADDVVLAVPPSVWKGIHFTPELPSSMQPQMGTAVKFLAEIKTRYWKKEGLSSDSLSDGDVSMTWEGTEGQEGENGVEMTCFSGGPAAEHARSRPPVERKAFYEDFLNRVYPGYAANRGESQRFMDWPADPFTMAGYSFAGPREIMTNGPIFHQGIDRLHFAGEHTSYKFCGYMEGALNSGVSLARRIAKRDAVV
jgi:monoamine oxidase